MLILNIITLATNVIQKAKTFSLLPLQSGSGYLPLLPLRLFSRRLLLPPHPRLLRLMHRGGRDHRAPRRQLHSGTDARKSQLKEQQCDQMLGVKVTQFFVKS